VKILTLTQPYATLVALLAKGIETRSWSTSYRGPIAIHAAKGLGPVGGLAGLWNLCSHQPFRNTLRPHYGCPEDLPRGAIVAVATLADVRHTRGSRPGSGGPKYADWVHDLSYQERAFGDYSPGRYAWLLSDVRPLHTPLPYRGAQGLRPLPAEVVALVEERL